MLALLFATPALRFTPAAVTPKAAATTALAARQAAPVMQMTMMRGERPPPCFVPPLHQSTTATSQILPRFRVIPFHANGTVRSSQAGTDSPARCTVQLLLYARKVVARPLVLQMRALM